jgi:hypothetical protein
MSTNGLCLGVDMAEKITGGWRERVTFTDHAWTRIERLSERLGLDEKTTLRMMVALQLAQLEATFGAAESVGIRAAMEQDMTDRAGSFLEGAPAPVPHRQAPAQQAPTRQAPGEQSTAMSAPGRNPVQKNELARSDGPPSYFRGL